MFSNRHTTALLLVGSVLLANVAMAAADPSNLTLGAKLQLGNWQGTNDGTVGNDFDTKGNQLSLSATYQTGRLYFGINLQGGDYNFANGAPNQNNDTPPVVTNDVTIKRGESDLLVGYYFWDRISLFLDIKQVTNEWQGQHYSMTSSGLGIGISGFYPINPRWNLYGSFGVVPLNIKAGGGDIGDGGGTALEIGSLYRVTEHTQLNLSIKGQTQIYDFNNGDKQTHHVGGLVIGVSHQFPM